MKQISFFQYLNQSPTQLDRSVHKTDIAHAKKPIPSKTALKSSLKVRKTHGGLPTKGKRKEARPFSSKKWIHLILKSHRAQGNWSLLSAKNKIFVENLISEKAKKFHIKVDHFVNVGNHLHLKIKAPHKKDFQQFLKSITNLIARFVTGAKRGQKKGKFWQGLAFTRILTSYFEEKNLEKYLNGNEIEALFGKAARESFLKDFNHWIRQARRSEAMRV